MVLRAFCHVLINGSQSVSQSPSSLTYVLLFRLSASYGYGPYTCKKIKANGQLIRKTRVEVDGHDRTYYISRYAVCKQLLLEFVSCIHRCLINALLNDSPSVLNQLGLGLGIAHHQQYDQSEGSR